MRSRDDCMPIIWLCMTLKIYNGDRMRQSSQRRDDKTDQILALKPREPSGYAIDKQMMRFCVVNNDSLNAAIRQGLSVFLLGLFEDARCTAELAATTWSLGGAGPGGGGGPQ